VVHLLNGKIGYFLLHLSFYIKNGIQGQINIAILPFHEEEGWRKNFFEKKTELVKLKYPSENLKNERGSLKGVAGKYDHRSKKGHRGHEISQETEERLVEPCSGAPR